MRTYIFYYLLLIALVAGCKKNEETKPIQTPTVNAPTVDFTFNQLGTYAPLYIQFINLSSNADSYSWDYGDGTTSTEVNPNHLYTTGGTYTVRLNATNSGGTTTKTKSVIVSSPPSSARISALNMTVFPVNNSTGNPWDTPNTPDIYFQIADSTGNIIYNGNQSIAFNIDASFLPYSWNLPTPLSLTAINSPYYIIFYDYDPTPNPAQLMGNLTFKLSDYISGYPSSIYLNQNGFTISMDVSWQ